MHRKSPQSIQKNYVLEFLILSALKLCSCGVMVFIYMNTYLVIEGRNIKTFLKENYHCFGQLLLIYKKNVEHGIVHDIDSAHGVCIN